MKILNKIQSDNESGKVSFISYITAGDPDIKTTLDIMKSLANNGTDIIELGIPFSDPISDGPTIQKASERSLKKDINISKALNIVKEFRKEFSTPIIIFGYYNPFLRYGINNLMRDIKNVDANGILVVDLPPEESHQIQKSVNKHSLELVYLVAPTSTDYRIQTISNLSNSFIYLVSVTGVTGTRSKIDKNLIPFIKKLKKMTKKPICVGFGISSTKHGNELKKKVNGIVIGCAIVKIIEKNLNDKREITKKISNFCRKISKACRI